ncbi:MAG TPA: phytase [Acidimicrobiia bacterium]|nr:phytase [Acidimicrobiia bacterium]
MCALLLGAPAARATIAPAATSQASPKPPTVPIDSVQALIETPPVEGERDAADDMAIWVNPWDRSQSLVIGTDKAAKNLEVYDLAGQRLQRIPDANQSVNNVDIRYGFPLGGQYVDIVVTGGSDLAVYKIDPVGRRLVDVTARDIKPDHGAWGVCLYRSAFSGSFYAFAQAVNNGHVEQFELFDNGSGQVDARSVRGPWDVHPQPVKVEDGEIEACTVDDVTGDYYVVEQDVGVWRYGAEPTASTLQRTLVLSTYLVNDGDLVPDIEGIVVIRDDYGSFLLASSQGDSTFAVYDLDLLTAPYQLLRKFRVTGSSAADSCSITDGIDATSLWLGAQFPHGMFICQDDRNTDPGTVGNQNFKFVPLDAIIPGINPYMA